MNVLYEYAKNESGNFINIKDAIKTDFYYLESEYKGKVQMIPVQGDVKQWHFRSKVQGEAIRMTAAHINLQAKLCNDLSFYCKELDIEIKAASVIPEYRLSNNRIVDVAYFDTNNDFLCGIEVVHTNDISPEKFQDLYNSDYLIFKVYTNAKGRFIFVDNKRIKRKAKECARNEIFENIQKWKTSMGDVNKELSERARRIKERIIQLSKDEYNPSPQIRIEIVNFKREINKLNERLRKIESKFTVGGTYFSSQVEIKSKLRETEGEKGELIRDIEKITEQINNLL